jgi:hypothetical protein
MNNINGKDSKVIQRKAISKQPGSFGLSSFGFIAILFHGNRRQVVLCCFLVFILLIFVGCYPDDDDEASTVNLTWVGPKTYTPSPNETIAIEFGVNDNVDVLTSGILPITIQKSITNTGTEPIQDAYIIRERVVAWVFIVAAGSAGYIEGDLATRTVFECNQQGPPLAPGETRDITFVLGGPDCSPTTSYAGVAVLPCGMYKETLTVDFADEIKEIDEYDNIAGHFFFVPSDVQWITINVVRNPANIKNVNVVGQTVQILAPVFDPGETVTTHTFNIIIMPAMAAYTVNGRTPVFGSLAGTIGVLVPGAMPLASPGMVNYNITIPDPSFLGPCNSFLGGARVYEEKVNTKITAISYDGCIIVQRSALVSVIYECSPN